MLESFYNSPAPNPTWARLKSRGHLEPQSGDDRHRRMMAELPPILRTLLITDGTVTRSLESYFWEPINIQQITLEATTAKQAIPWLHAKKGEPLLIREVSLTGGLSQKVYTTAFSIIRLGQVPESIRSQLEQGGIGIGVLISQFAVESYREILDIGHTGSLNFDTPPLDLPPPSDIVYRSYRIVVKKEPTILITEKFPKAIYR